MRERTNCNDEDRGGYLMFTPRKCAESFASNSFRVSKKKKRHRAELSSRRERIKAWMWTTYRCRNDRRVNCVVHARNIIADKCECHVTHLLLINNAAAPRDVRKRTKKEKLLVWKINGIYYLREIKTAFH